MRYDLRVTNVVCSGRLPKELIIKYPDGFNKFMRRSKYLSEIRNEHNSPILAIDFPKKGLPLNAKKRVPKAVVSLWSSGSCNIVGVLSYEEGLHYFNLIIQELKRIISS